MLNRLLGLETSLQGSSMVCAKRFIRVAYTSELRLKMQMTILFCSKREVSARGLGTVYVATCVLRST